MRSITVFVIALSFHCASVHAPAKPRWTIAQFVKTSKKITEEARPSVNSLPANMVDVRMAIPDAIVSLKYATRENFLGEAFYQSNVCALTPETVEKIGRAEAYVEPLGFRLVLWDCARPVEVQQRMWDACVAHHSASHCAGLVANPRKSLSRHTYGTTVDVSLADLHGEPVIMPTKFDSGLFPTDDETDKAHARSPAAKSVLKPAGWSDEAWKNYQVLKEAMTQADFLGIRSEWWHWQ